MSRWKIEKDGTGIERSGTGIEKSGTGIEKSGTGIEKSGTGIEKSGTGIRRIWLVSACAAATFAGGLHASTIDPAGSLQVVVNRNTIAVSWIFDGSVFSGVAPLAGSYADFPLTEVALTTPTAADGNDIPSSSSNLDVTGNGTGNSTKVTGNGTGNSTKVTGNGTGNSTKVTGNGTGNSAQVTGNGTGRSVQVTGNGTGISAQVTGNGTGNSAQVTGNGTGRSVQVTGNGTGSQAEALTVTLPGGNGLAMEVTLDCGFATVAVVDSMSVPVAFFARVPVVGDTGMCTAGYSGGFKADPGRDFRLQ